MLSMLDSMCPVLHPPCWNVDAPNAPSTNGCSWPSHPKQQLFCQTAAPAQPALAAGVLPAALQALYQKQGRSTQFTSQDERDAWIMKEVGQLEATIATKETVAAELRQKIQEQESALMELSASIGDTAAQVKQREEDIAQSRRWGGLQSSR